MFHIYAKANKPKDAKAETSRYIYLKRYTYPVRLLYDVMSFQITKNTHENNGFRLETGSWKVYFEGGRKPSTYRPNYIPTSICRLFQKSMDYSKW